MYAAKTSGSNATASYSIGYCQQPPSNASLAMPMSTYTRLQASGPVSYTVAPPTQMPSKGMYGLYEKG